MTEASVLLNRVREYAACRPDDTAFVFIRHHDDSGERITWRRLWRNALAVARRIPAEAPEGATGVMILCEDEFRFVVSLLATWMRGAVAIPASGRLEKNVLERNSHILTSARPNIILHDLPPDQAMELGNLCLGTRLIGVTDQDADGIPSTVPVAGVPGGLLQFTSGSTSKPKAVLLSQQNIAANCQAIIRTYSLDEATVGLHWLPLHHDMGLVGSVLAAMWLGIPSVILRPTVFIQRPLLWFELISKWRATITSAPNFAYERLCDAAKLSGVADVDLSCLENVVFGGETVALATVERLHAIFGPHGLSRDALAPSYGLAETTLLVSAGKREGGPVFSTRHSFRPAAGLGRPIEDLTITVRDETTGEAKAEGELGQIWVEGHCVGIVVPEDADWRAPGERGPIRTGDHGFIENGILYVTGRDANRLIVRGRNIFSEDVESLVRQSQPSGYATGVAAIGIESGGSEALCILIEQSRRGDALDVGSLNHALSRVLGVKAAELVVLKRYTLPRTSSGKIRHAQARADFLRGIYRSRILVHATQTTH